MRRVAAVLFPLTIALAVFPLGANAADTISLGSSSGSGSSPFASVTSNSLERPASFTLEATSSPARPISGQYQMFCYQGSNNRMFENTFSSATGSIVLTPSLSLPGAESCFVGFDVGYRDVLASGTITASVRGSQLPAIVKCRKGKIKKGRRCVSKPKKRQK